MNVSINLAGENAIGFVDASEYMDNRDTILVYGVDDMKETLELIREGKVEGSIVTSFYQYGYYMIMLPGEYGRKRSGFLPILCSLTGRI